MNTISIIPDNYGKNHHILCPHCGSKNLRSGAGLKPGQQSISCSDCQKFVAYEVAKLQNFKRRKRLTSAPTNLKQSQAIGEGGAL